MDLDADHVSFRPFLMNHLFLPLEQDLPADVANFLIKFQVGDESNFCLELVVLLYVLLLDEILNGLGSAVLHDLPMCSALLLLPNALHLTLIV